MDTFPDQLIEYGQKNDEDENSNQSDAEQSQDSEADANADVNINDQQGTFIVSFYAQLRYNSLCSLSLVTFDSSLLLSARFSNVIATNCSATTIET